MFFKRKKDKEQKQENFHYPIIAGADEYLWEAAEILIEKQQGSVAILQYALKIGFNRSLSIMEQLYQIGVVGETKGNTISRDILVDKNGLKEIAEKLNGEKLPFSKKEYPVSGKENNMQSERAQMYNNKIDYMTGEDFEVFVAQILKKIGFYNIQLTKGSGDQGVDILAERDSIKYAFQCKRYDKPVGNKAVQEVFAGKFFYHCHAAIVVTNSYFTQSAKDLAHENGVVLWDGDYLRNIANGLSSYFDIKHENRKKISEDELIKALKEIAIKIQYVFSTFNIKIPITNIDYGKNETVFCITPPQGVRIKTVLSYKQEIEFELKIPIQMRVISEKGYIGISISSNDLEKHIKANKNTKGNDENEEIEKNEENWKEFEEYHEQVAQVLIDLGKIYIDIFNENLHIKSYITDAKRINEKTAEIILRCENSEQAKAVRETEKILNENINADHKIELINDRDVCILIKFK